MNESWESFNCRNGISVEDLWPSTAEDYSAESRTLSTAKLYPVFNLELTKDEMTYLSAWFWIDLVGSPASLTRRPSMVQRWRQSVRLSLDEINGHVNVDKLLGNRRHLFNTVSSRYLVDSIVKNTPIAFDALIRNIVQDGYAQHLLSLLDEGIQVTNNELLLLLLPVSLSLLIKTLYFNIFGNKKNIII